MVGWVIVEIPVTSLVWEERDRLSSGVPCPEFVLLGVEEEGPERSELLFATKLVDWPGVEVVLVALEEGVGAFCTSAETVQATYDHDIDGEAAR